MLWIFFRHSSEILGKTCSSLFSVSLFHASFSFFVYIPLLFTPFHSSLFFPFVSFLSIYPYLCYPSFVLVHLFLHSFSFCCFVVAHFFLYSLPFRFYFFHCFHFLQATAGRDTSCVGFQGWQWISHHTPYAIASCSAQWMQSRSKQDLFTFLPPPKRASWRQI